MKKEQQNRSRDVFEQLPAEQERGALAQRSPSELLPLDKQSKRSWWWVELWSDKRGLIKEAAAHFLFFAGLFVSLEGAHRLLKWSTLPPDELYVLNKVHFYMYAIILVIFAVSLIIKVLNSELSVNGNEVKQR